MESILPFVAVAAIALACPLGMAAIGGGAWLIARARGQKKDFSAGCMGGHGDHAPTSAQTEEGALSGQVTQLQAEVELLKAQLPEATSTKNHSELRGKI